jgi:predicted transcriptional regulator
MRRAAPSRDIPPPLEMLCLKALWSLGEGNVAEVRGVVAASKPLAYTTVMTVLDRLAKKNAVTRRKVGRAFVYAPEISREAIRRLALKEFVDCFFDGSEQRLAEFLRRNGVGEPALELEVDGGMDAALL